tara:strand:- start:11092 stop:12216 length:1125 start_codon:yes stop_codon:yes gene_type:complete
MENYDIVTDVYRVGTTYYQTLSTADGEWTFYQKLPRPVSGAKAFTDEEWDAHVTTGGWFQGPDAEFNKTPEEGAEELADFLMKAGFFNTTAMSFASVRQVIADAWSGEFGSGEDFDSLQFTHALMMTDYGESTIKAQRTYDSANDAEKNMLVVQAAEKLAGLWRTYTGALLDVPGTYADLENEAPALFQQALRVASGRQSEQRAVLDWIQPEAMKIDQSPWQRMLDKEDRLQRQEGIDIETQRGTVRDLAESYGLTLTDKKLMKYGQQLVDNEVSLDELEQKLDEQSIGLYPYKPKGMEWVTYADPYIKAKADLWEVADPDHTDEDLQDILQSNGTLGDWKKQLRKDPHWYGTDNARNTFFSAFGSVGRGMGFG